MNRTVVRAHRWARDHRTGLAGRDVLPQLLGLLLQDLVVLLQLLRRTIVVLLWKGHAGKAAQQPLAEAAGQRRPIASLVFADRALAVCAGPSVPGRPQDTFFFFFGFNCTGA